MATHPNINHRLRVRADDPLRRHAAQAKPQHRGLTKQTQQHRAFTGSPQLLATWTPFLSSLFDTVRVVIKIKHPKLDCIAKLLPNMTQNGYVYFVRSPYTDAQAQVMSRKDGEELILEFSIPKFLTGQNIVGIEDLHAGCKLGIQTILKLIGIRPTPKEIRAIGDGKYRLTRVDIVVHVDCATSERAAAMMWALRNHIVGKGKDVSMYEADTVYVGQHSRRRSLKAYRKAIELIKNPMPAHVYGRQHLTNKSVGLVRLELVLRRDWLTDRKLDSPLSWTPDVARRLMQTWADRLIQAPGVVADVAHLDQLTPALQIKTRAWLFGDQLAFTRDVTRATYRHNRKRVLDTTGIDVDSHLTPEQQGQAQLTIRQMFERGFGYRDHADRWDRLRAAVKLALPVLPRSVSGSKSVQKV